MSKVNSENNGNQSDFTDFYISQYLNSRYGEDQRILRKLDDFSVNPCNEHKIHQVIIDLLKPFYQNQENFYLFAAENIDIVNKNGKDLIASLENLLQLKTKAGRSALLLSMLYPSASTERIVQRQELVQFCLENFDSDEMEIMSGILQILVVHEHHFITAYDYNFVSTPEKPPFIWQFIEKNPSLYTVHYCGLSALAWCFSLGLKMIPGVLYKYDYTPLQTIIAGVLSWYGSLCVDVLNFGSISSVAQKSKQIHYQLLHVSDYLRIIDIFARRASFFQNHPLFIQLQETMLSEKSLNDLRHFLQNKTLSGDVSLLHNWGNVFVGYQKMKKIDQSLIANLLYFVGELDLALALAKVIRENKGSNTNHWCFAKFQDKAIEPTLTIKDAWNPLLLHHKPFEQIVCNDISLNNKLKNIILTGPNGCGKTAITTSIAMAIITAQALGFSTASECVLTPFDNVCVICPPKTDSGNGKSKFTAEIKQLKQVIESLEELTSKKKFAFMVFDEICTGTNPLDGEVAAQEFLKHVLQKNLNAACFMLVSTHYRLVAEVAKQHSTCINYKVNVHREKDGSIKKMFTWSPGISSIRGAIDLFKENIY